jgi:hypothetical protein
MWNRQKLQNTDRKILSVVDFLLNARSNYSFNFIEKVTENHATATEIGCVWICSTLPYVTDSNHRHQRRDWERWWIRRRRQSSYHLSLQTWGGHDSTHRSRLPTYLILITNSTLFGWFYFVQLRGSWHTYVHSPSRLRPANVPVNCYLYGYRTWSRNNAGAVEMVAVTNCAIHCTRY